jgi:hypothetical protein
MKMAGVGGAEDMTEDVTEVEDMIGIICLKRDVR